MFEFVYIVFSMKLLILFDEKCFRNNFNTTMISWCLLFIHIFKCLVGDIE